MAKYIRGENLTLKQWLKCICDREPTLSPNNCFPSLEIKTEFLEKIHDWSDNQIKFVLRAFLVQNGFYGIDEIHFQYLMSLGKRKRNELINKREIYFRMFENINTTREGLTWILDFLPNNPAKALQGLSIYFEATCQSLPDNALVGIRNAAAIIAERYINYIVEIHNISIKGRKENTKN